MSRVGTQINKATRFGCRTGSVGDASDWPDCFSNSCSCLLTIYLVSTLCQTGPQSTVVIITFFMYSLSATVF